MSLPAAMPVRAVALSQWVVTAADGTPSASVTTRADGRLDVAIPGYLSLAEARGLANALRLAAGEATP